MKGFISYADHFEKLLRVIVHSPVLHARWINTLSYLENCGAKKIAACEHPTLVKEEMLKHAAEEFRHAFYLKRQIKKISSEKLNDYRLSSLLGGFRSMHYLQSLDMAVWRHLRSYARTDKEVRQAAYLLVTYAIELRATELYTLYDQILREIGSSVHVKAILLEEEGHIQEMQEGLLHLPDGLTHAEMACKLESRLCRSWLNNLEATLISDHKTLSR